MERLPQAYAELLSGDGKASDKFRELEKRILPYLLNGGAYEKRGKQKPENEAV